MYSPYEAVYGHDRTHVRRMAVGEYLQEVVDEEQDLRGATDRNNKNSNNNTTTTASGAASPAQYELRRMALTSRDPAVVFSSKYPSYDRLGRELCVLYQMQDMAVEQELRRFKTEGDIGRRSGVRLSAELQRKDSTSTAAGGAATVYDDVSLSTMSRVSSFAPSRPQSARPSEFSIYRDTARPPLKLAVVNTTAHSARKGRSAPAVPMHNTNNSSSCDNSHRAAPSPRGASEPPTGTKGLHLDGSRCPSCGAADKENSTATPPPPPLHGLRMRPIPSAARSHSRASQKRSREPSGRAVDGTRLSRVRFADDKAAEDVAVAVEVEVEAEVGAERLDATALDPVRFTAMRDSAASRITKQLFRATAGGPGRGTTTVAHPNPIPSSAYGLRAATIPASAVAAAVEANYVGSTAHMGDFVDAIDAPAPELRCGRTIRLGDRWLRLTTLYPVAEAYEAVEVPAPVEDAADGAEGPGGDGGEKGVCGDEEQLLLYRWRGRHAPHAGSEARRAALGLGLCAPEVKVCGYAFRDGGGVTVLRVPTGYRAVPLSGLPLTAGAFGTALKVLLRALSSMVARRTVHGHLTTLGEVLLAFPTTDADADAAPLVVPVHWERSIDFSVFADRSAGRAIPYDTEDGSERPLLTLGKDVATVLQCLLEHPEAASLTSEQYVLLQRLVVIAAEPTQVANYLIQIKSLMVATRTDLPSLRQAYKAAVDFYTAS